MNTYESCINHIIFKVGTPSFLKGNKGGTFPTYLRTMVNMKFPKYAQSFLFLHSILFLLGNAYNYKISIEMSATA